MSNVLQNTKYQNAIDACNSCFEAFEYCSTECCLRGEDVKKDGKMYSTLSRLL